MSDKCPCDDLFPPDSPNVTVLSNPFSLIKEQFQKIHYKALFDLVFDIFANKPDMQYMQIEPG